MLYNTSFHLPNNWKNTIADGGLQHTSAQRMEGLHVRLDENVFMSRELVIHDWHCMAWKRKIRVYCQSFEIYDPM